MKTYTISSVMNGYILKISDVEGTKSYVFPATLEFEMLQKLGLEICGYKIEVRRK